MVKTSDNGNSLATKMIPTTNQTELTQEQRSTLTAITLKLIQLDLAVKPTNEVSVGPIITVFRFLPEGKTKVNQLENASKDISMTLGKEVMIKRFPGESTVSVTVPNTERSDVNWKLTATEVWKFAASHPESIPLGFGVDYLGRPVIEDLCLLPHLLIAGTTGGGKSTLLNALLASLVYTLPASKLQLVLSDTKGVEFLHFVGVPHLLFPPATSPLRTLEQLDWLIQETENRMKRFASVGAKNISDFNKMILSDCFGNKCGPARLGMPRIILMIDEVGVVLGDTGKLGKERLLKIASQSRASGIHAIIATQRPSAKIIDGDIKANFPSRLTFRLPSLTDSRVILDTGGAEQLIMQGDMLYQSSVRPGLQRLHSPRVDVVDIQGAVEAAIHRQDQ